MEDTDIKIEGESKAEAFKRLATNRTKNVLKALRVLGNCSNHGNYEYTPEQVLKIMDAIRPAVDALEQKFTPMEQQKAKAFTL